jgi:hypothetical protein
VLGLASAGYADILFDIDPNVPDTLSLEVFEAPAVPSPEVQATWELWPDRGWDWTVFTVRPLPAGTFDLSRLTIAAHSSLPTRIGAEWEYENGAGGWGGPGLQDLTGQVFDVGIERDALEILHIIFLSPQEGQNDLRIDTLRVEGLAHIIPEPQMEALAAIGAMLLVSIRLILRRAKCLSCMGR